MKALFLGALLMVAASGCKSNPYCLNCKDSGNGVITPEDMTPVITDGGGTDGAPLGPDMLGQGGPCTPTNGGIEICDGLDNDCNGKIDDVPPEKLIGDPKNCGACGNECKFPHAFGVCVGGFDGGMPTCQENGCQPGYVDLNGNPADGCEYVCTPTTPSTEICDGKDNNCDGQVDEGFTSTWFDSAHQMPKYDNNLSDCGQCGTVCSLGPGTVMACQGTGTNGQGQCAVVACFNGNDTNGVHQTYRHNPAAGLITVTGCEYHCAKPATTTGNDCNPNGACTFPAETCNGIDDDCDFVVDDNAAQPAAGTACPDGTPGKLCTSTGASANCGKGICAAGTISCTGGALVCSGSVGPSPEICDPVTASNPTGKPLDNDCNGKVDDPFTATWSDAGFQNPRYDSDPNHCGKCIGAVACALPHGTNICRLAGGDSLGSCAILACTPGYSYVSKTDSNPAAPACDKATVGNRDSTQTTTGIGCFYMCPQANPTPETCDGVDNDCDGCIDNGLTTPAICSTKGECAKTTNTVACKGAAGYKCTYGAGVDVDGSGNLTATEAECDGEDNNCNGACDENFPDVPIASVAPDGTACNNPRTAKTCSGGQGACQLSGAYACKTDKSAEQCAGVGGVAITAAGDPTKASNEKCNGKDDDCNGLIDESTTYVLGGTTYQGWHDPTVKLTLTADPIDTRCSTTPVPATCAAHTVWVYSYEASKPDATAITPGSLSTRACSNTATLPWANVTMEQATAACAAIKDSSGAALRLCTAWEWQQTCNLNAAATTDWSMSASTTSYQNLVCNDSVQEQRCSATLPCQVAANCNSNNQCTCATPADCSTGFTCTGGICVVAVDAQRCAPGATPSQCGSGNCNASGQCVCATSGDCSPGYVCSGSLCVGAGAWPTGSQGATAATNSCAVDFGAANGGKAYDLSGNLQEWTSTPVTVVSGTTATIGTPSGGQVQINGLAAMLSSYVGAQLVITNATNAANNGTFDIVSYVSATAVVIANPAAVVQTTPATVKWSLIYNKLRGGNYATTSPTGESCEFDFDIEKAAFVNNDVGFRCCADHAP